MRVIQCNGIVVLIAGFTTGTPWLPVGDATEINVADSLADPESLFYTYQKLIQLRKSEETIISGSYQVVETGNLQVLAYLRELNNDKILVVVNFSAEKQSYKLNFKPEVREWLITNYQEQISEDLKPYEAFAIRIK